MFTVNHQTNRISPVKTKRFSELGFAERKHLQLFTRSGLCLAHEPSALGEELLIIQKEFDGFLRFSCAHLTACKRLCTLIFLNILYRCDFTVFSLIKKLLAI